MASPSCRWPPATDELGLLTSKLEEASALLATTRGGVAVGQSGQDGISLAREP